MLRVSILCTDPRHPVNRWLESWAQTRNAQKSASVSLCRHSRDLEGGDFLFLVSCHQIIGAQIRSRFRHTLVLHASRLPAGRGMSPQVWQVLEGCDRLVLTLLDAEDALDSGNIWHQLEIPLDGTELHDELGAKLYSAEIAMLDWALANCDTSTARPQHGEPTYYARRTPEDSRLDVSKSIASQFDLLRVADPERYPAWFEHRGQRYLIRIEKDKP